MKIIAVIPVHGRLPLLKLTIQRLYLKNKINHVICIGEKNNKNTCIKNGAEFIESPNFPIGRKLNNGFKRAKDLNADAVTFVGSSDWLSDDWFKTITPYVFYYGIIGKKDFNMCHVGNNYAVVNWPGYPMGSDRTDEFIGIGRLVSAKALDIINWEPFDYYLNNSLDRSMWLNLKSPNYEYNCDKIQSLSISCDKWSNMHKFNMHNGKLFNEPVKWLEQWFPEIFAL